MDTTHLQSRRTRLQSATRAGRNVGDLVSEAMIAYLARDSVSWGRSTLRALAPEPFPEGNERLSGEIAVIVYGDRQY